MEAGRDTLLSGVRGCVLWSGIVKGIWVGVFHMGGNVGE